MIRALQSAKLDFSHPVQSSLVDSSLRLSLTGPGFCRTRRILVRIGTSKVAYRCLALTAGLVLCGIRIWILIAGLGRSKCLALLDGSRQGSFRLTCELQMVSLSLSTPCQSILAWRSKPLSPSSIRDARPGSPGSLERQLSWISIDWRLPCNLLSLPRLAANF